MPGRMREVISKTLLRRAAFVGGGWQGEGEGNRLAEEVRWGWPLQAEAGRPENSVCRETADQS